VGYEWTVKKVIRVAWVLSVAALAVEWVIR
jgi:hypothetical protein